MAGCTASHCRNPESIRREDEYDGLDDDGGGGGVELEAIASSGLHWGASSSATCDAPSALLCSAPALLTSTGTWPVPGLLFSDGLVAPKLTGYHVCANHRCYCAASCMGADAKLMYPYIRAFAAHIPSALYLYRRIESPAQTLYSARTRPCTHTPQIPQLEQWPTSRIIYTFKRAEKGKKKKKKERKYQVQTESSLTASSLLCGSVLGKTLGQQRH